MKNNIVSAAFDSTTAATTAVDRLRGMNVPDDAISVIAKNEQGTDAAPTTAPGTAEDRSAFRMNGNNADEVAEGTATGAVTGAGLGMVAGLAALAIPGVGPFVAAGAIGTVLGTTAVGAGAGGLIGALTEYGVGEDDATYYEDRMSENGAIVIVDADRAMMPADELRTMMREMGGSYARSSMENAI